MVTQDENFLANETKLTECKLPQPPVLRPSKWIDSIPFILLTCDVVLALLRIADILVIPEMGYFLVSILIGLSAGYKCAMKNRHRMIIDRYAASLEQVTRSTNGTTNCRCHAPHCLSLAPHTLTLTLRTTENSFVWHFIY